MAYVGFRNDSYEFFSKYGFVLFSSDNTHQYLLDYIYKDFRCLSDLFEIYISNRMNTTTFEPINYTKSDNEIGIIIKKLKAIHPYFKYEHEEYLKKEIGNYFNQLLVYTIENYDENLHKIAIQKQWYIDRLSHLMPPTFYVDYIFFEDFYNKFQRAVGDPIEDMISFHINIPGVKPKGFSNAIRTQNAICNLLYFILDISAPNKIKKLEINQRIWLYKNMFNNTNTAVSVTQNLLFFSPKYYREEQERSQKREDALYKVHDVLAKSDERYLNLEIRKIYESNGLPSLPDITNLNVIRDGIPDDMDELFNSIIEYASKVDETALYEEYKVDSLQDLLYLEVMSMIRSRIMVRRCTNCDKYFVAIDKRKKYCDRINKNKMPCSDIGSKERFPRLKKKDPALTIYDRARNTHYARKERGKMSDEEYYDWLDKAKEGLEKFRNGEISPDEFQARLK